MMRGADHWAVAVRTPGRRHPRGDRNEIDSIGKRFRSSQAVPPWGDRPGQSLSIGCGHSRSRRLAPSEEEVQLGSGGIGLAIAESPSCLRGPCS